jgi:hypothetical protein
VREIDKRKSGELERGERREKREQKGGKMKNRKEKGANSKSLYWNLPSIQTYRV